MGRPFTSDPEEDAGVHADSQCTEAPSFSADAWIEAASKAVEGLGPEPASVLEVLKYLATKRKPAFLPTCEPSSDSGDGLLDSKLGGMPYLLPGESWPCYNGTGLLHLWQLRVRELPTAVQRALGESSGLMQVFISSDLPVPYDEGVGPGWFVVRVLKEEQLVSRDPSSIVVGPGARLLPTQRVTGFSAHDDWPMVDDLVEELPDEVDSDLLTEVVSCLEDAELYNTLSGDKLLGWPNWCQGPEWIISDQNEVFMHVVQIEGDKVDFIVGDGGTLVLQRHPTRRDEWGSTWACC